MTLIWTKPYLTADMIDTTVTANSQNPVSSGAVHAIRVPVTIITSEIAESEPWLQGTIQQNQTALLIGQIGGPMLAGYFKFKCTTACSIKIHLTRDGYDINGKYPAVTAGQIVYVDIPLGTTAIFVTLTSAGNTTFQFKYGSLGQVIL